MSPWCPFASKDIGEGWWEGQLGGKIGLFPESYVEVAGDHGGDSDDWDDEGDEDWGDEAGAATGGGMGAASAGDAPDDDVCF